MRPHKGRRDRIIISLSMLVNRFLMQPGILLAFWAVREHCWLVCSYSPEGQHYPRLHQNRISLLSWLSFFLFIGLLLTDWIVFIISYTFLRVWLSLVFCLLFSGSNSRQGPPLYDNEDRTDRYRIRVALYDSSSQGFDILWVTSQWGMEMKWKQQTQELIWVLIFLLLRMF